MSEQQKGNIFEVTREQLTHNLNPIKLVATGLLVDLELHNGWVKRDQFVPIPIEIGKKLFEEDDRFHFTKERHLMESMRLQFVGPTNNVITIKCRLESTVKVPGFAEKSITIPSDMTVEVSEISDHDMLVNNPRLCLAVCAAEVIIGNDGYINGDLMRRNVPHNELGREERDRRY